MSVLSTLCPRNVITDPSCGCCTSRPRPGYSIHLPGGGRGRVGTGFSCAAVLCWQRKTGGRGRLGWCVGVPEGGGARACQ